MKTDGSEAPSYASDEVVSGTNVFEPLLDETVAFETLLELASRLPVEAGPESVTEMVLDTLSAVAPKRAFGVCLVQTDNGGPYIGLRLPSGVEPSRADPTRLFVDLPDERIVNLPGLDGSTLHVASTTGRLEQGTTEAALVKRAATLLAFGIRTALTLRNARPVSEQVAELRAQLVQAEKLATLGQIVAGVVHELANPVTSIVACAAYLERQAAASRALVDDVEHIRRIGRAADRILKFSRDLGAYARPATEAPGAVLVSDVIAQAFAFCEHELSRYEVELTRDYDEGAPPVLGQAGPLTQVFVNLFTNAAHAMTDHGGRLVVRTRLAADELCIDVTDTGTGIPRDTLERIFEPFFTTKEKGRGTGLGLAIVREIVNAHRGAIVATSTLGEGSTFTLTLPLYKMNRDGLKKPLE
jgi:signal transduction histidine kinase